VNTAFEPGYETGS